MSLNHGDRVRRRDNSDTGTVLRADSESAEVAWDILGRARWEPTNTLRSVDSTPTEPGWYWFRADQEHETPVGRIKSVPQLSLVEDDGDDEGLMVGFWGGMLRMPVLLLKGDWDRIEPPAWMRDG